MRYEQVGEGEEVRRAPSEGASVRERERRERVACEKGSGRESGGGTQARWCGWAKIPPPQGKYREQVLGAAVTPSREVRRSPERGVTGEDWYRDAREACSREEVGGLCTVQLEVREKLNRGGWVVSTEELTALDSPTRSRYVPVPPTIRAVLLLHPPGCRLNFNRPIKL